MEAVNFPADSEFMETAGSSNDDFPSNAEFMKGEERSVPWRVVGDIT